MNMANDIDFTNGVRGKYAARYAEGTNIVQEDVTLVPAALQDAPLLANLMELYLHDLSEAFAIELGADGRFGYESLPLYWSEPERRFPFFIRSGEGIVGFVLITRDSDDSGRHDIAEFFVLRRYRRSGVGRRAAVLAWDRFPGQWTVRVSKGNTRGIPFWSRVVEEYTNGEFSQSERPGEPHDWAVFAFESGRPQRPQTATFSTNE
jgi:predicted acetyltransferase